jgi:hypothetical protein
MKPRLKLTILAMLLAGLIVSLYAQRGPARLYDGTAMALDGIVEKVVQSKNMHMTGVHLLIKSQNETFEVHLGPAAFLAEKNATFKDGDTVAVVGWGLPRSERFFVIAREVKKGDQVLTLRNEQGVPLWSRSMMCRMPETIHAGHGHGFR